MSQETNSAPVTENKMGTMPIGRLVFNMSLPMMISMLVQALYNIVDSIFVAKLSENALTAVSLAFPLQTLIIAVATGTGVGVNALLSKSLGAHKYDEANKIGINGAVLYAFSYVIFLILGLTIVKPFYMSQIGNADVEIMDMGVSYLSTVMIFSFGIFTQVFFESHTYCVIVVFHNLISLILIIENHNIDSLLKLGTDSNLIAFLPLLACDKPLWLEQLSFLYYFLLNHIV